MGFQCSNASVFLVKAAFTPSGFLRGYRSSFRSCFAFGRLLLRTCDCRLIVVLVFLVCASLSGVPHTRILHRGATCCTPFPLFTRALNLLFGTEPAAPEVRASAQEIVD